MIEQPKLLNPPTVNFHIARLQDLVDLRHHIDTTEMPVTHWGEIPIGNLRKGIIFSIYSEFQVLKGLGHGREAQEIVKFDRARQIAS